MDQSQVFDRSERMSSQSDQDVRRGSIPITVFGKVQCPSEDISPGAYTEAPHPPMSRQDSHLADGHDPALSTHLGQRPQQDKHVRGWIADMPRVTNDSSPSQPKSQYFHIAREPLHRPALVHHRSCYPHHNAGESHYARTLLPISYLEEVRDCFLTPARHPLRGTLLRPTSPARLSKDLNTQSESAVPTLRQLRQQRERLQRS